MTLKTLMLAAAALLTTVVSSQAQYIFTIGSQAVGSNPGTNENVWPLSGRENPGNAIDGDNGTKYLNFGETGTGYIFTPSGGAAVVTGINFVTGGDQPPRDPATYILLGSNTAIASNVAGTIYQQTDFTEISAGALTLPDDRGTAGGNVVFPNTAAYDTFLLIFLTVKDSVSANSMQIAEAMLQTAAGPLSSAGTIGGGQLSQVPEPTVTILLGGLSLGALLRRRRA